MKIDGVYKFILFITKFTFLMIGNSISLALRTVSKLLSLVIKGLIIIALGVVPTLRLVGAFLARSAESAEEIWTQKRQKPRVPPEQ